MTCSRGRTSVLLALALVGGSAAFSGCSSGSGDSAEPSATAPTTASATDEQTSSSLSASDSPSTSPSPAPTPTPETYPSLEAPGYITQEYTDNGVAYTSVNGEVTMEVPGDWVNQTDGNNPLSELYFRSPASHFIIFSNLGVPLTVEEPEGYATALTQGQYLGEAQASYVETVSIDGLDAWVFSIEEPAASDSESATPSEGASATGGATSTPSASSSATPESSVTPAGPMEETARIYVLEFRGQAREITVHAPDEAGYETIETILTEKSTLHGKDPE